MLTIFIAELKRQWWLRKTYPADVAAELMMLSVLFCLIFWGASYMAGPTAQFGTRLDSVFVGYVAWLLLLATYGGVAHSLQEESSQGTLQQLMTSPFGLSYILFWRTVAIVVFDLIMISVVAVLIMLITGSHVHPSMSAVPFIVTQVLAAIGFGFMIGSLVFLYKRVRAVLMILQTVLLFIVMAPIENWGTLSTCLCSLLPIAPSAAVLRGILVHQQFNLFLGCLAVVNAVLYLAVGMVIFSKAEARAKHRGLIGAY